MNALLRIEAVNLGFVIGDTEDLSTRRGGSSMLLAAVNQLKNHFAERLQPISTGASVGLFALQPAAGDGQQLLAEVREFLQNPAEPYAHATFAADLVQDANFHIASEKAVAANRWRQMRELNFTTAWGESSVVCGTDEIRPGTHKHFPAEGDPVSISASVFARRQAGRDLRQKIYSDILGETLPLQFTNETESLSTFPAGAFPEVPPNLNGKMAVFYADGNRFGHFQRECKDATALQAWDSYIKQKRQALLRELLSWLEQTPWARTDTDDLRFETLLWGGDELLFLLPAWLGLEFAQKFFALTADWRYAGKPLTHATGLVFAKHSTPISQLQKLTKQLAEHGKADARKNENTLSWVVLESFDHTGDQIDKFWERNGIPEQGWDKLLLTGDRLAALRAMQALKDALPRSAMVRALRTLATGQQEKEHKLLQSTYQSTEHALNEKQRETLAKLWQVFDSQWNSRLPTKDKTGLWTQAHADWAAREAIPWTALLELWDYLLPEAPAGTQQPTAAREQAA